MRDSWSHPLYYQAALSNWMRQCEEWQQEHFREIGEHEFYSFKYSRNKKDEKMRKLIEKICVVLFGALKKGKGSHIDYNSDQLEEARMFAEYISDQYAKNKKAMIELNTILVCCKSFMGESRIQIFRIRLENGAIIYIDSSKNVYDDWDDWLRNNNLTQLKCYPKDGYYPLDVETAKRTNEWIEFAKLPASLMTCTKEAINELSAAFLSFAKSETSADNSEKHHHLSQFILKYKELMKKNTRALNTFIRFLTMNHGQNLKIVRILRAIEDPDHIFDGLLHANEIAIHETRDDTLVVNVAVTKEIPTTFLVNKTLLHSSEEKNILDSAPRFDKAFRLYLKNEVEPILSYPKYKNFVEEVLQFDEMKPNEVKKARQAFFTTCKNKPPVIRAAVDIAQALDVRNIYELCAVTELIILYKPPPEASFEYQQGILVKNIEYLVHESEKNKFIEQIRKDIMEVEQATTDAKYVFETVMSAVYHYRKHSQSTDSAFKNPSMNFYFNTLPEALFIPENLRYVSVECDRITESYSGEVIVDGTIHEHVYGKLLKKQTTSSWNPRPLIRTMHKEEDHLTKYEKDFKNRKEQNTFEMPYIDTV